MFNFKNGRIYADTQPCVLSFAMQDGFWIETSPGCVSDNRISLYTKDKKVQIDFEIMQGRESIKQELTSNAECGSGKCAKTPEPIAVDSLEGYMLCVPVWCEIQVDIGMYSLLDANDDAVDRLCIVITSNDNGAAMQRADVKEFLAGIRID